MILAIDFAGGDCRNCCYGSISRKTEYCRNSCIHFQALKKLQLRLRTIVTITGIIEIFEAAPAHKDSDEGKLSDEQRLIFERWKELCVSDWEKNQYEEVYAGATRDIASRC